MTFSFGPRRGTFIDIDEHPDHGVAPLSAEEVTHFEDFDLIYRSLCALLFNYVPASGHPGGSISAGRVMAACRSRLFYLKRRRPCRSHPPHPLLPVT